MDSSQVAMVAEHFRSVGSITSMEAFGYGITRLSAVIYVLRNAGWKIESVPCAAKNRYGRTARFVRYVCRGEWKEEGQEWEGR